MKMRKYALLTGSLGALLWAASGALCAVPALAQAVPLVEQCNPLAENQGEEVARALAALGGKDAAAWIAAAKKLGESCEKRAVKPLIGLLGEADAEVRAAAVEALGKLGDRSSLEPLLEMTNDADWRVRLALARALCAFQQPRASYAALNFILGRKEPEDANSMRVCAAAAIGIHQLRDVGYSRKALLILLNYADSKVPEVKQIALETVYALKDTRNGPHEFVGILKQSNNPFQRRKAAYWIGELRVEFGRSALMDVAEKDPDAEVRKIAAAALVKLGKAKPEE